MSGIGDTQFYIPVSFWLILSDASAPDLIYHMSLFQLLSPPPMRPLAGNKETQTDILVSAKHGHCIRPNQHRKALTVDIFVSANYRQACVNFSKIKATLLDEEMPGKDAEK